MNILKKVSFDEVKEFFKANHPFGLRLGYRTNGWAFDTISLANEKCGGNWSYVELTPLEALGIYLPYHKNDCGRNTPAIPFDTQKNLKDMVLQISQDKNYSANNPECWEKIDRWNKEKKIPPIFISTMPLTNLQEYVAYKNLPTEESRLFHLDGFHRMVSWGLNADQSIPVYAYVAGI